MIEAVCRTNLDDYGIEQWPTAFVAVPGPGDYVRAKSGKILKVVMVTHSMNWIHDSPFESKTKKTPYIIVELNK